MTDLRMSDSRNDRASSFSEREMADAIIAHADELLGEQLTFVARNHWIGRYELDLVFRDRHGASLIVELQKGALDRYHVYKVLDYYDEYKDRHPAEFVEVMIVANIISPERKERLAKRGVSFREIPAATIARLVNPTAAAATEQGAEYRSILITDVATADPAEWVPKPPPDPPAWLKRRIEILHPDLQDAVNRLIAGYRPTTEQHWQIHGEIVEEFIRWVQRPRSVFWGGELLDGFGAVPHLSWHFYPVPDEAFQRGCDIIAPELIPFLALVKHEPHHKFFERREAALTDVSNRIIANPSLLSELCGSIRSFWQHVPAGFDYVYAMMFLELLGICLADIIRTVSTRLYHTRQIPIDVDSANQFITRPVKLGSSPSPVELFRQLASIWALPKGTIGALWNDGEAPDHQYVERQLAFPVVDHPFRVGTELLVNAYGSKAYTIARPSEVLLQAGDIKSIVLKESANHGCIYKVRYRDDLVSFGQIALRGSDSGDLLCDHFSTGAVAAYIWNMNTRNDVDKPFTSGSNEFALVASLVRDFLVCEDRERHYSVDPPTKKRAARDSSIAIRYLPRFRVHYIGVREGEYNNLRADVIGHHVSGHLRRVRSASPLQLQLAKEFDIQVPDGFTFVRPHDRGGHARVYYRSRSALALLYGSDQPSAPTVRPPDCAPDL